MIKELYIKLSAEFGRGFDKSNLWNMRAFSLCFPKIDAMRREWTKRGTVRSACASYPR
ncbi:MAG: hypothetical protein IMF18_00510 [Proteobacteria bacterium]|nr:hypothetical protein [Pseudomonadota bacterium]